MASKLEYVDFEVKIDKEAEGAYVARVNALGGRVEMRFTDLFSSDKRMLIRQTLTTAALRSVSKMRGSPNDIKMMKDLGRNLFDQVINGPMKDMYNQVLGQAVNQGRGVRVRLVLDPSLDDLPWEFLYSPQNEFMNLDPKTPVVRFIEQPNPLMPLKDELPLNILIVIASPTDFDKLDTEAEKARIAGALESLVAQGLVRVSYIEGRDTWFRLIDALRPDDMHIVHFIGHGGFDSKTGEGVLYMEQANGQSYVVGSEAMRILVRGRQRLRLVVLNSCSGTVGSEAEPLSSVAAGLVYAGVPAVIAMQFEITDTTARTIAETFYKSLALNFPVDAAMTEARRQVALENTDSLEWATPVLFMQVPDGQLFNFTQLPEVSAASAGMATGTAASTKNTVATPPPEEPAADPNSGDLTSKAAKRYKDGEEAMLRGEWASARDAFRGALLYVPDYKDAGAKATYCDLREQTRVLSEKARQQYANEDYKGVGVSINQIRTLDPSWVDSAGLQVLSECGLLYQQAIGSLKARDRERGADLLRQIMTKRPNFKDASSRLENLAQGGDGLLGLEAMPPRATTPPPAPTSDTSKMPQPQAPSGNDGRIYEWNGSDIMDLMALGEEIKQFFFSNGYETQLVQQGSTILVQGRKGGIRRLVGMGQAATVMLEPTSTGLKASVGGGSWIEQGAAVAVSMFILWPLLITGGVGAFQQKQLMDNLWNLIERQIQSRNGRRIK